jgi:hypothetical protein
MITSLETITTEISTKTAFVLDKIVTIFVIAESVRTQAKNTVKTSMISKS